MRRLRIFLSRLRGLVRARRLDRDLQQELTSHIEEATEEFVGQGLSPVAARQAALRHFGGVAQAADRYRDGRAFVWLDHLHRDARQSVRALRRSRGFTAVVVLTLALGLGANAATFGMVDRLLLRPFTIDHVDRLVLLTENGPLSVNQRRNTVAVANFLEWQTEATSLGRFAAFTSWSVNLSGGDVPERIEGERVTSDFFPLVGVTPALGRLFHADDEVWGRHRQVVLGDGLWRRRFGADPAVIGLTVRLDGEPYEVVGVAPAGFDFPTGSEVWAPLAFRPEEAVNRARRLLTVIAERPPMADLETTRAEMAAIYARQQRRDPEATRGRQLSVRGFTDGFVDFGMPTVLALQQAAAAFVLLIVCTNVASLLLASGAERQRELALRLALGASRGQVVRQLLLETLVLGIIAVPLALGVTWGVLHVMQAVMPASLIRYVPGWRELAVDGRIVTFTIAVAMLTSGLFGLLPALSVTRALPTSTLRDGGRSVTAGRRRSRLRRGLVVAQIALALPLLVASGLAAIAAQRFATGPQGFNPDGTYQLRLILPSSAYPDQVARRQFAEQLIERSRVAPGVTAAALTTVIPSSVANQDRRIGIDGVADDPDRPTVVNYRAISSAYLDTMQIPLIAGRGFTPADAHDVAPVSIVSESFARTYLAGGSPLGRRVRIGASGDTWTTVVGVSADTVDDWLNSRREPTLFVPFAQFPSEAMTLVARTSGDAAQLADGLRRALADVDPHQPAFEAMTVREVIRTRTTGLRVIAGLMAALGGLALVLSALGIYGVMAHLVVQRRQEFSLRMALGASARDVLALTLGQGARLTGMGIAVGLVAAAGLARLIEGALFGIVALEWPLFASTTVALGLVALLAAVVPALRAMRLDPAIVLRE